MNFLYVFFFYLIRLGLQVLFQTIVATGTKNIPRKGPVVFAWFGFLFLVFCSFLTFRPENSNHPNMVLDPVIVASLIGVNGRLDGHFWAKAPLFKGVLGWVLRNCGAVPVVRRTDVDSGAIEMTAEQREQAVEAMFQASYKVLGSEGGALVVFPEGTSHSMPHLLGLKPGTARLVIGLLKKTGTAVPIIPVGLNYVEKDKMRSQVLVKFGEPIIPTLEANDNFEEKVHELTNKIEVAMKGSTINAETWEDLTLIDLARQIYSADYDLTLEQNVELAQRFTETYAKVHSDPMVAKLKEAVVQYKDKLEKLHVPDRYFSRSYQRRFVFKTMILKILRMFLALVLALPGYLIHLPLHYIGMKANNAKDKETISQTKLSVILLLVPVEYGIIWTLVYFLFGRNWLIYTMIALPLSGYLHLLELKEGKEHARSLMSLWRVFVLLFLHKEKIDQIRALRRGISDGINELAKQTFGSNTVLASARRIGGAGELLDEGDQALALKTFTDSPIPSGGHKRD